MCIDCGDGVSLSHRAMVFCATDEQDEASGLVLNAPPPADTATLPGDDGLVNVIGGPDADADADLLWGYSTHMTQSIDLMGKLLFKPSLPRDRAARVVIDPFDGS